MQDSLCRLVQACYADHLGAELGRSGIRDLDYLKGDVAFLQAFKTKLGDPDFYKSDDLLHTDFSMHMMFVANYLLNDYEALPCFPGQMWSREFGNLMGRILAFHLNKTDAEKSHTMRGAAKSAAVNLVVRSEREKIQPVRFEDAYLPFQTPLVEESTTLQPSSLDKVKNVTLSQTGSPDWASTGYIFAALWERQLEDWKRAMATAINQQVSTTETRNVAGIASREAPPMPMFLHEQTTWTGRKVQNWLNSGMPITRNL